MRKIIVYLMMVLVCISFVSAAETLIWNMTFDTYATGTVPAHFTETDAGFTIAEFPSAANKSLWLDDGANDEWGVFGLSAFNINPTEIHLRIIFNWYQDDSDWSRNYFPLNKGTTYHLELETATDGIMQYVDSTATPQGNCPTNDLAWNSVQLDITNATFNLTVNGAQCAVCTVDCETDTNIGVSTSLHELGFRIHSLDTRIDDIFIYNMTELPVDTTAPVITFVYPNNGTYYNNYQGWINWTTNEDANCSINRTRWNINDTLTTSTDKFYFNSSSLSDGGYSVNVSCWDHLNNNGSSILTWYIDTLYPSVKSSLQNNDTIAYNNLAFQINFTDENLMQSFNITAQDYIYNLTNINLSTYSFNGSINLENYSVGEHLLNATFCDAHTKQEIGLWDYDVTWLTKKLSFDFGKKGWFSRHEITIKPKNPTHFEEVTIEKKKDRYKFSYIRKKENKGKDETFIVTGDSLSIIGNDLYTGWIVDDSLKKWIDFENDGKHKATLKRISSREIEVTTKGEHFESAGDLNCNNVSYKFYKFNYSIDFSNKNIETEIKILKLIVNITDINITSNSSLFYYNITSSTPAYSLSSTFLNYTKTLTINRTELFNETIPFNFSLSLNGNNYSFARSFDIYKMYIDTCGNQTNDTTINITFKDSQTYTVLTNASLSAVFKIWRRVSTESRNYTFNATGLSGYKICIYPNWTSYTTDFVIDYSHVGYNSNSYIKNLYTLDNQTDYLDLYLTTGTSLITINVVNEFSDGIVGYTVEAWQYVIATNSYVLISTEVTDQDGIVKMDLVTGDNQYKFLVYDSLNNLKYTSARFKLFQTSYTFAILPTTQTTLNDLLYGFDRTLTVPDDNPYNITYTWNDLTNLTTRVCLNVTNTTINSTVSLYGGCSFASSGTLSYLLNVTDGYYPIYGSIISNVDGLTYVLDTDLVHLRTSYDVYDSEGMIYSFIFIGTTSFIGVGLASVSTIGGVIAIVLLIFSSIIMFMTGFMNISLAGITALIISGIAVITVVSRENR